MKSTIIRIALLAVLVTNLSSCFVSRDPHGRHADRGRRYPHDEHPEDRH